MNKVSPAVRWFCSSVARLIFNIMFTVKGDNSLIFGLSIVLCIFNSILPTYLLICPLLHLSAAIFPRVASCHRFPLGLMVQLLVLASIFFSARLPFFMLLAFAYFSTLSLQPPILLCLPVNVSLCDIFNLSFFSSPSVSATEMLSANTRTVAAFHCAHTFLFLPLLLLLNYAGGPVNLTALLQLLFTVSLPCFLVPFLTFP